MEEKVLRILEELCDTDEVREDKNLDLFENGLLDSLGVIELILEIEEVLGIKLQPTEIKREEIETPNKIINLLVERG